MYQVVLVGLLPVLQCRPLLVERVVATVHGSTCYFSGFFVIITCLFHRGEPKLNHDKTRTNRPIRLIVTDHGVLTSKFLPTFVKIAIRSDIYAST